MKILKMGQYIKLTLLAGACSVSLLACSPAEKEVKEPAKVDANVTAPVEPPATPTPPVNASVSETKGEGLKDHSELLALIDQAYEKAATTKGDGNPAMWKLADEDTTIYIYGTVHLLPEDTDWQTPEMLNALQSSDTLVMELDPLDTDTQTKMVQLMLQSASMEDGQKLSDVMTAEQIGALKGALDDFGLPLESVEDMQPWFVGLQMQIMQLLENGYNPEKGVESVMTEIAEANGMEFGALETVEQQMKFLSGDSMEDQIDGLMLVIATRHKSAELMDLLLEEWVDGDMAGMDALIGDPALMGTKEAYDKMLTNRNAAWIPQIEDMLDDPGSKFIAVGAAHLAGPDSVIKMLEAEGHTVQVIQ